MSSQNKSVALRFIEFGSGENLDVLDEIAHPDYKIYDNLQPPTRLEKHKQVMRQALTVWEILDYTVQDIIEEDDKVAIRWKWKGKMKGDTEMKHLNGIWFIEMQDDLIKTIWSSWDQSIFGDS